MPRPMICCGQRPATWPRRRMRCSGTRMRCWLCGRKGRDGNDRSFRAPGRAANGPDLMATGELGQCPQCAAPVRPADSFCAACGCELGITVVSAGAPVAATDCRSCGSSQVSDDGYCEQCGWKAGSGRDHVEFDLGTLAGVTDRGLRHQRNEDAMALPIAQLPAGNAALAVICDGVSTSDRPDEASLAAADCAVRVLGRELRADHGEEAALLAAASAAGAAVSKL